MRFAILHSQININIGVKNQDTASGLQWRLMCLITVLKTFECVHFCKIFSTGLNWQVYWTQTGAPLCCTLRTATLPTSCFWLFVTAL